MFYQKLHNPCHFSKESSAWVFVIVSFFKNILWWVHSSGLLQSSIKSAISSLHSMYYYVLLLRFEGYHSQSHDFLIRICALLTQLQLQIFYDLVTYVTVLSHSMNFVWWRGSFNIGYGFYSSLNIRGTPTTYQTCTNLCK